MNYPGGYYCQCPETRQIAASQITTYPEQIPESDCQGFPFNHLGLYTCSNNDYGYQECQCPEAGTGTFKLVEGTGGCLGKQYEQVYMQTFFMQTFFLQYINKN